MVNMFCKTQTVIENGFRVKEREKVQLIIDSWSLKIFKIGRLILLTIGSIEACLVASYNINNIILGVSLIAMGVTLRCYAIYSLGSMWNFNIILYKDHKVIKKGIYSYIKHPAYIGNIYLTGILLCINSTWATLTSIPFIIIFYLYRANIENSLLKLKEVAK